MIHIKRLDHTCINNTHWIFTYTKSTYIHTGPNIIGMLVSVLLSKWKENTAKCRRRSVRSICARKWSTPVSTPHICSPSSLAEHKTLGTLAHCLCFYIFRFALCHSMLVDRTLGARRVIPADGAEFWASLLRLMVIVHKHRRWRRSTEIVICVAVHQ